jgi:hypothetical protein
MTFFILYVVLFPLFCFLVKPYKQFHNLPILTMLVLAIIRYDTTYDYSNYVRAFFDIRTGNTTRNEVGYHALNQVFSFSQWGFIPVFALSTLTAYLGFCSLLKRYNVFLWGTVSFFLFGFITIFDEVVRQAISIGIFAYSLKYVSGKRYASTIKYFLLNSIGILFHTSAIATLLCFPLLVLSQHVKIHIITGIILISLSYLVFRYNITTKIAPLFISFVPARYQVYITGLLEFYTIDGKRLSGLSKFGTALVATLPLLIFSKTNDANIRLIINISFFSSLFCLLLTSVHVFERFIYYLYIPRIICIALLLKKLFTANRMPLFCCVIFCLFVIHFRQVTRYYGIYNRYYTVFSARRENHIFYQRPPMHTEGVTAADVLDRSRPVKIRP